MRRVHKLRLGKHALDNVRRWQYATQVVILHYHTIGQTCALRTQQIQSNSRRLNQCTRDARSDDRGAFKGREGTSFFGGEKTGVAIENLDHTAFQVRVHDDGGIRGKM